MYYQSDDDSDEAVAVEAALRASQRDQVVPNNNNPVAAADRDWRPVVEVVDVGQEMQARRSGLAALMAAAADVDDDEDEDEEDDEDFDQIYGEEEEEDETIYEEDDEDEEDYGDYGRGPRLFLALNSDNEYDEQYALPMDDDDDDDDEEEDDYPWPHPTHRVNPHEEDNHNAENALATMTTTNVDELKPEVLPDSEQLFRDDFDQDVQDHLCAICFGLLQEPSGCGVCQGRFCHDCLIRHYQQHRSNMGFYSATVQHAPCPTCRNRMQNGVVPDLRYAGFLASEAFTCRYAHCGLRILASQMKYHETFFCQGVRVRCRYSTLGCEWVGYKQDVKAHEDHECGIAQNPGLLSYITKNLRYCNQLTQRIQNLERRQALDMRVMQQQVQLALNVSRRRAAQRLRGPGTNHNTHGNPWNNHNNAAPNLYATRGFRGGNNRNDMGLDLNDNNKRATNPLHFLTLVCCSFVTPGAITNNTPGFRLRAGVWRTLIGAGEERAFVHNVMVLLPTILLGIKLTLRGWNHRHDLVDALVMMMSRGDCTIRDFDAEQFMNYTNTNVTEGGRFYSCVTSPTSGFVGELAGDGSCSWSPSDWMRLLAIPISGIIAVASLHADRLTPMAWAAGDITDGENVEELSYFRPRPHKRTWMNANFTGALLVFYICAIPLLQSILASSSDDNSDDSNNKSFAVVFGCILYATMIVPSILVCFLNASSRNAVAHTQDEIRLIAPVCLIQGNANASMLTALSYGVGMLFTSSMWECVDGFHWTVATRFIALQQAPIQPRRYEHLKFLLRPHFLVDCRTEIYLTEARLATYTLVFLGWAKGRMQEYFSSTSADRATASTINDYQDVPLLALDENAMAACPATDSASSKMIVAVSYLASFVGRRLMVYTLIMLSLAVLDEVIMRAAIYGFYLFKQEALKPTFFLRSLRAKISWPGTGIFLLYLLALKQICDV